MEVNRSLNPVRKKQRFLAKIEGGLAQAIAILQTQAPCAFASLYVDSLSYASAILSVDGSKQTEMILRRRRINLFLRNRHDNALGLLSVSLLR